MGAVHGGGVVVGAGAGDGGAAPAACLDPMIEWEGCRPCKLWPGEYAQSFVDTHRRKHEEKEAEAREERDREAQRAAEAAQANKAQKKKAFFTKKMKKSSKYN